MRFITYILALALLFWSLLLIQNSLFAPVSTLMMADFFRLKVPHRHFVRLNHISPNLIKSAVAAEDGKFCTHHGVDWDSLHKAVNAAVDNEEDRSHGASTISMQLTKNLFLWPGRSYLRKTIEIPLAISLDTVWGKRKIMESYLNVAEFGDGLYGAESAAQRYFGKSAAQLNMREAALLVATLPNPHKRNAARPGNYVASYAGSIAARANNADISCLRRK